MEDANNIGLLEIHGDPAGVNKDSIEYVQITHPLNCLMELAMLINILCGQL